MEEGLHQIGSTATVRVNGLGAYELNLIRANFQGALNMFLKLETVRGDACAHAVMISKRRRVLQSLSVIAVAL
jgi:hypothetical protein